ncbi:diguanylate cyclase (GGDEF domain) with PAS/PAC sensor [Acetobacter sp. CAG:977]|nr:diguanylate cyclase (GGDEF domain) with PAS/PAC sensor [Acetobacter sp. CAG:977]
MSFLFAVAHAADAAENAEQALFSEVDLSLFAIALCAVILIASLLLGLRYMKVMTKEKELKQKVIDLQNELLKTQKNLEELTKERNRKFDPYSSPNTKSIIFCLDKDGVILSGNDYAFEFFGYADKNELLGKNIIGTLVPLKDSHGQNMANLIERIKNNPRLYVDNENENICKNGKKVWVSWTNRIIYDSEGNPTEIRSVGFDISPRKRLEDELRQMTVIDPITGVLNRQRFLDDGTRELKRARRYGRELSVLLMTIDRFDALNSEHGTAFSDEAVKVAVTACQDAIRESDYLGRLADVEFALLLPETPLEGAMIVAERIRTQVMHSDLMVGDVKISVTTSIGIATRLPSDETIDSVLLRAFNALRTAKEHHNNVAVAEQNQS